MDMSAQLYTHSRLPLWRATLPPLCNHLGEGLKLVWMLLETSFVAGEIDPWVLGCPPHSLVTMPTMLSQLCAGETS